MKLIKEKVYEGRNIYSHKKCIRLDLDLEGFCEIPTKMIPNFNFNLAKILPELKKHRCGIDEEGGFLKRLEEGTYLAHVCEHIIIAIHNILGLDISYGKAREINGDLYYVVFQYEYKRTGLSIANLAVDLINSLIKQIPINFEERINLIKSIIIEEMAGPSTRAICDAAKKKNLPVLKLGESSVYQIGYGKHSKLFGATIGNDTKCVSADISCDKLLTKELLECQYIPVARGEKVYNTISLIKASERIGYPLVLKPQYGSKGSGVILNIQNERDLLIAYKKLSLEYKDVIVEKYIKGNDYRVCVVDYKVVAVARRIPPFIVGDGEHNIKELIGIINSDPRRGENHERDLTKIKIDDNLIDCLSKNNLDISSIPQCDEKIYLRENANLSTGGIGIDCTDEICRENIDICIRCAKALGLDICGIDLCTEDISIPLFNNGVVVEVNAAPGIRMHHHPYSGESRDVAGAIVDMMFMENFDTIPVISVTGTNGKTTTTRLISHVISMIGYTVGMATTGGISVGGKYIDDGDDTGPDSAKTILLNRDVDVAVLETARGGIVRSGLAYDLADVGVITNITEDHLGIDGIETMEDLCLVKSLVVEAIKEDGYAVINADDEYSTKILNRIKAKKIFFSLDNNNKYIVENIKAGYPVVYVDKGVVFVENNNKKYTICHVDEIPLTKGGVLKHNIYNAIAAVGALVGINVDYCIISKGLKSFNGDDFYNPGRFNEYNIDGVKVILDYGHNIDGYKCVMDALKLIPHRKLIGVIGVPGDRKDDSITKIGQLCSGFFDTIIVKEDIDKRGRGNGEVAKILEEAILSKNKRQDVKVIYNELEAMKYAINIAMRDDIVIVFFEEFDTLLSYIKELERNNVISRKISVN